MTGRSARGAPVTSAGMAWTRALLCCLTDNTRTGARPVLAARGRSGSINGRAAESLRSQGRELAGRDVQGERVALAAIAARRLDQHEAALA